MSRLTERDEFGNADIIGVDSEDLQLNLGFNELNLVTEALNKLACFEENEEDYGAIKSACAAVDAENERLRKENASLCNVVRCTDCEYMHLNKDNGIMWCRLSQGLDCDLKKTDFCSRAKLKQTQTN